MNKIKVLLTIIIVVVSVMVVIGCDSNISGAHPPFYTRNIQFDPTSGRVGDVVTITGEDFLSPEYMQWEWDNSHDEYWSFLEGNLVLFNCELSGDNLDANDSTYDGQVRGTPVVEFIEFDVNKIVCKVPKDAKTGKIIVLRDSLFGFCWPGNYHPSEETFTVLDASGAPIY